MPAPLSVADVPREAVEIVDLLNSRPSGRRIETLDDDSVEGRRLRELRTALVAVVSDPASPEAWDALTAHAATVTFRSRFTPGASGVAVGSDQVAGSPAVGSVVRALTTLVDRGRFGRIRLCANEKCGGAFYDTSRSGTQRWHAYETCGNRANVRAHRARLAEGQPAEK